MKKNFIYISTLLFSMLINVSFAYAIQCDYSPIASVDEVGNYTGHLPDYTLPEDLKWMEEQGYYIQLDSYNSGKGHPGGEEDVEGWSESSCPNIIRVTDGDCIFCDGKRWLGYSDLDSALEASKNDAYTGWFNDGGTYRDYDTFFIYDVYLKELQKTATDYDHEVSYTCKYTGKYYFEVKFNKDGYALSAESTMEDSISYNFQFDLSDAMRTTKSKEVNKCENTYVCLSNSIVSNNYVGNYYTIFVDELDFEEHKSECKDDLFVGIIADSTDDYDTGCRTYATYIETLDTFWKNCENNVSSCKDYSTLKDKVSNLCNSLTKYADYEKSDCLKSCLNFKDDIINIEDTSEDTGSCGFSQRLLAWIANIVRWIKYIIPVAVIVLGILDFIKAVGADKDDELKKAQGKFIKRLIAAALIFIIPFIIEFVLDKMGFGEYISGCGIIDL
ncbi:MAG: hypothetical protein IJY25_05215 [Bacilli bacterium]|nr:hypothetical protein [Bacilli bacterium]